MMRGNTSDHGPCYYCGELTNMPRLERLMEAPDPRMCADCVEEHMMVNGERQ